MSGWRKLGRVFNPDSTHPWMHSHAANPVAEHLHGDLFRIYFSCRDGANRSSVGFVDIDLNRPQEIELVSQSPILSPGEPGSFDDSGISIACIVPVDGRRFLYYIGWNLGVTVPWRNSIGLAISPAPGQPFVKASPAAIMDRDETDPFSLSYPWVERSKEGWRMWYGSNLSWGKEQDSMQHVIKYAVSADGVHWRRSGQIVLDVKPPEVGLSRPCVEKAKSGQVMWYCFRGPSADGGHYRIGYAESANGTAWVRMDGKAGIDVSLGQWDGESISYPYVFEHKGRRYMLYNGNGYGRSGFGIAIADEG